MINPSEIDLKELPWLPFDAASAYPENPVIYFVTDNFWNVFYIGQSKNAKGRWGRHHKSKDLEAIGASRVVFYFVEDDLLLGSFELAFIRRFNPPLNTFLKSSRDKVNNINKNFDKNNYTYSYDARLVVMSKLSRMPIDALIDLIVIKYIHTEWNEYTKRLNDEAVARGIEPDELFKRLLTEDLDAIKAEYS